SISTSSRWRSRRRSCGSTRFIAADAARNERGDIRGPFAVRRPACRFCRCGLWSSAPMRKVYVLLSVVALFVLAVEAGAFVLEHNRIQNLCRSSHSRIETAHDAIDVMRSYRDNSDPVGKVLARGRQFDAFQNDGYATSRTDDGRTRGGGWLVEQWNTPLMTR